MNHLSTTIGLAIRYDLQVAPHTSTVLRTLALARNVFPSIAALRFAFADDHGTEEGALHAATSLQRAGARIVIGHLSSDAAIAAVPYYARSGTLLLLPTATASSLTTVHAPLVRLCPPDRLLAQRLVEHLASECWCRLRLAHEPTRHGCALAADIAEEAASRGLAVLREDDDWLEACSVFVGSADASVAHVLEQRRLGRPERIYLTDDAASTSLATRLGDDEQVRVVGFAPAHALKSANALTQCYLRHYGETPGVNARETLIALHIASQLATRPYVDAQTVRNTHFDTPIGGVRLSNGQNLDSAHAIWLIRSGCLVVERVLGVDTSEK